MKLKKIKRKAKLCIYILMIVKNVYIVCLKFTFIYINIVFKNNNLNKFTFRCIFILI